LNDDNGQNRISDPGGSIDFQPKYDRSVRYPPLKAETFGSLKEETGQSIVDFFERQVTKHYDKPAVKVGEDFLTYRALDKAANSVAQGILARLGPGNEPVGVLFEKSLSLIVAIIGVFKAGKIYVPLDPSHPKERLIYILNDTEARMIVTDKLHFPLSRTVAGNGQSIFDVDSFDSSYPDERPGISIPLQTLSCILYTSGSTGEPKGVMHSHRSQLHNIMNYIKTIRIGPGDRIVCPSSLAFSGGLKSILGALLSGATSFPVKLDALSYLSELLVEEEITIYHSVVSAFRHFINLLNGQEMFPNLRCFYITGETLYKADIDRYRNFFPSDRILINVFGLTETGDVRQFFINEAPERDEEIIPVGYEVDGAEVLLLDEEGKQIPIGEEGVISVRSSYLSPGYWRRPELTRAAFLPDPDGGDKRIYLTGDLGRLLPDECLVHLGRKDFQVKIRGHLVNITEIERSLGAIPGVVEKVVTTCINPSGGRNLVAYVVSDQKQPLSVKALHRCLSEKLPNYMIPSFFVILDALPLTPNGKIDRKALPEPNWTRPQLEDFVAPRSSEEGVVAGIWEEVLGLKQVGVNDNFFELGGHSLLATQVISRLNDIFGIRIPLRSFFEIPTVAGLSEFIEAIGLKTESLQDVGKVTEDEREEGKI
jgi:amino acid adenylation domain-containing protein